MVTHISSIRIVLMLLIVLSVSIFLPDFYWKANKREINKANIFYSPIKKGFVLIKSDARGVSYADAEGNYYSRDEFEALTPFLNFRQLMLSGKLPETIDSIPIPPKAINLNNFSLRVPPAMINTKPLQLFPLLESASGRLRLELPPDVFRIDKRMEFITCLTNTVNENKSALFTAALVKEGFTFPAKGIYGNPSTKKPFDQGYFVLDSKSKVFHTKMVKGAPYCKDTGIPQDLGIVTILPTENELREFYALLITEKNEAYFVSYDKYKLISLPVENYNHEENTLYVKGDIFYRVLAVNKDNGYHAVVTDRQYHVLDRIDSTGPGRNISAAAIAASYIFPFTIAIEKDTTPYIDFYFRHSGFSAIPAALISLLFALYYLKKRNVPALRAGIYSLVVTLTGVYGLIALLTVRDFDDDPGIS